MATNKRDCEACQGNVTDGKSCYACGLKGPAGEGWAMLVAELRTKIIVMASVETLLRDQRDAAETALLAAGFTLVGGVWKR